VAAVSRKVLGIDPGQHGALVFLGLDGRICEIEDMPCIEKEINAHMMARLIQGYGPVLQAVVEQAHSMPEQGRVSIFNYGVGYGKILGVLAALDVPITHMPSSKWKKKWNLGRDKNMSRQRATERWPDWADNFKLVKHDGRAEAALIAATWWEDNRGLVRSKKPLLVPVD
jgi:crossover junction endodeoxyribonuclease RuvC